ncbi:alpha-copaene synthase-like isoform X3 [Mercurialis annua]|uniref:alpha-copaene synthase-like isoform X3 n=1 Tax=Mercurialis annua TaxID=3986 RepID=UPI0024AE6FB6|nr:alpha-copaene synthase-like isoform X3 [Mercurialis annua]
MFNQLLAVYSIQIPTSDNVKRTSSSFNPTIWGDQFLKYATDSKQMNDASSERQHEGLKLEVRRMIRNTKSEPRNILSLIDAVQRLGVNYHFKSEINEALQKVFDDDDEIEDLYSVALRFRLLRQHGIKVSSELFDKFKESDGNFKTSITNDVFGMLSLYEAAHLSIPGENILDEALDFTTATLQSFLPELTNHLATHVSHSLNRPIRKCLPRLETRYYIDAYPMEKSYDETLLKFAKLDFNMLQKLHQKELYIVREWDIKAKDALPEYMKMIYITLLDIYNEYEENVANEQKPLYSLYYAKEAMKRVTRAYLAEAKWLEQDYIPTMEEYMKVSLITCCYPMLATTSFLGLGEIATKDAYEWASKDPKIIRASAIIGRLMDDIVSHEFEQTRKHVASAVECYMKQYGAYEEEIVKSFRKEIENAWKDINEDLLNPTPVPMPLLECVLNLARAMDVIYKDEDGYTNSHILKELVASVLMDHVLL